jgi:PST family polysaccharide transporter
MVGFGLSLVAMALVNYAAVNIDNALIAARIGAAALGYYMLAYSLVLLPATNIGGLVTRVMFPTLSLLQSDRERFVQAYASMLRAVSVATFPLIVGLGVTAQLAVLSIYGPKWEASVVLLQILTAIGIFQAINVSGVVYSAIGKPHLLLLWGTISLVILTIGFLIGVNWGVTGVALSYMFVSPFVSLPPHLIANRLIGFPQREFFRVIAAPFLASMLMAAVVLVAQRKHLFSGTPTWVHLVLLASLGGLTYGTALLGFAAAAGARKQPLGWIIRQTVRVAN